MQVTFAEAVGAFLGTVALAGIVFVVAFKSEQMALMALGALIVLTTAASQYFLRAKVQPSNPDAGPTPPIVPHG